MQPAWCCPLLSRAVNKGLIDPLWSIRPARLTARPPALQVKRAIASSEGPQRKGTTPEAVRWYDDRSLFTGECKAGGRAGLSGGRPAFKGRGPGRGWGKGKGWGWGRGWGKGNFAREPGRGWGLPLRMPPCASPPPTTSSPCACGLRAFRPVHNEAALLPAEAPARRRRLCVQACTRRAGPRPPATRSRWRRSPRAPRPRPPPSPRAASSPRRATPAPSAAPSERWTRRRQQEQRVARGAVEPGSWQRLWRVAAARHALQSAPVVADVPLAAGC